MRLRTDKALIEQSLRHLTTEKQLTGKEIATTLGVSEVTVGAWHKALGIPRAKKFERHFKAKYGEYALGDLEEFLSDGYSYAFIGRGYGLSRERIRQIARDFYPGIWIERKLRYADK